jgi:hypothetical protein
MTCALVWSKHAAERVRARVRCEPQDVHRELVAGLCGAGRVPAEQRAVRIGKWTYQCVWRAGGWTVMTVVGYRERAGHRGNDRHCKSASKRRREDEGWEDD